MKVKTKLNYLLQGYKQNLLLRDILIVGDQGDKKKGFQTKLFFEVIIVSQFSN